MLRELIKDEEVLVIEGPNFRAGQILTVDCTNRAEYYCSDGTRRMSKMRRSLLVIGDKVVRGPDWNSKCTRYDGEGVVVEFNYLFALKNHNVRVKWNGGDYGSYRMNANYQDLKPTGDSEGEEAEPTVHKVTVTIDMEDTMTREQRAIDINKDVEARQDALDEYIAQTEEKIADLQEEAVELRKYKTDKDAKIAYTIKAHNLDSKTTPEEQAKAMLALKDKGIEV